MERKTLKIGPAPIWIKTQKVWDKIATILEISGKYWTNRLAKNLGCRGLKNPWEEHRENTCILLKETPGKAGIIIVMDLSQCKKEGLIPIPDKEWIKMQEDVFREIVKAS